MLVDRMPQQFYTYFGIRCRPARKLSVEVFLCRQDGSFDGTLLWTGRKNSVKVRYFCQRYQVNHKEDRADPALGGVPSFYPYVAESVGVLSLPSVETVPELVQVTLEEVVIDPMVDVESNLFALLSVE
jgi:hypothetical protein